MVACFRNDAIAEQRVQQPIVKAHIIYKDVHGREITDVSNGVWLNECKGETTFTIGENRSLILFHFGRQGMLITPWKESYTHAQSWMNDGLPSLRIRDRAITGDIDRIEIRLLSESSGSCIKQIVLKAEVRLNEVPTLTPDPTSSAG